MPDMEFRPEDLETTSWFDRKAEEHLRKNMTPVAGTCHMCMSDLEEDGHLEWCPEQEK